jgi:tetratricopeptide (TPR) repeat protein
MIGDRIRQLRTQLGLSQQQLAGAEYTRAYVSQVESGKCQPSLEALRILAKRLGKSVDYFITDDGAMDQSAGTVQDLLGLAESDFAAADYETAGRRCRQAITLCLSTDRLDLEGRAHLLLAKAVRLEEQFDEAIAECDRAVELFRLQNDRAGMAQALGEWGTCLLCAEDYQGARRQLTKALDWMGRMKSLAETRAQLQSYLSTTYYRLGDYEQAVRHGRLAVDECDESASPAMWSEAAMGLGWLYYVTGDLEQALTWTRSALNRMKLTSNPLQHKARHNLGIIEMARGNWETGYIILQECQEHWRQQGDQRHQASVAEDLIQYWWHRGDLDAAAACCTDASALLDQPGTTVLRSRLYRWLGRIEGARGNVGRARDLLRFSLELVRQIKAHEEVRLTEMELSRLPE